MKNVKLVILIQIFIIISLLPTNVLLYADYYRVYFIDKGNEVFELNSPLYIKTLNSISQKSKKRRSKILDTDYIINFQDVPVYKPYLDSIIKIGFEIKHILKWKNYIVVSSDTDNISKLKKITFIKSIQKTSSKFESNSLYLINQSQKIQKNEKINDFSFINKIYEEGILDYGRSDLQISSLGIDKIHKLGISGNNVMMGFIDAGYKWRHHKSLIKSKVKSEYDFIYNDTITENQNHEVFNQDHHGTMVFSIVAGLDTSNLIGTSPSSEFYLAKTENLTGERGIEEDNFAAAVEWLDSIGVDLINCSLGYTKFDSTEYSYKFEDLDGNTSLSTQYVNLAYSRGIAFFNSIGNAGPNPQTLSAPSDATNAISVGSLDSNLTNLSTFSSRGPNANNQIKPDFVAFGNRPLMASPFKDNEYVYSNGTSFSSPLISGGSALILSAFPEITPNKIKTILQENSDNRYAPDNNKGYGLPNFYMAMINYDIVMSPLNYYKIEDAVRIVLYLDYKEPITEAKVYINFNNSDLFDEYKLWNNSDNKQFFIDIPEANFKNQVAKAYIVANSERKQRRNPFDHQTFFKINPHDTLIYFGTTLNNLPNFHLSNEKTYLYPNVIYKNQTKNIEINIYPSIATKQYTIYDIYGRIHTKNLIEKSSNTYKIYPIDISNLSSGVYFIEIQSQKKKEILKFLIID